MPRINALWIAIALSIALLIAAPAPAPAAATLKATASGNVSAHRNSSAGSSSLNPGPGSLGVTYGAAASDADPNPSPPPADFMMQGILTGTGVARYGSVAGRAHAEASVKPASNFYTAGGTVVLDLGFTDSALVDSDSLAPGTPVTLKFVMTLEGSALHFADGTFEPGKVGAGVRYEAKVSDLDDLGKLPATGALVINSAGTAEGFRMLEFDTVIGHRMEFDVHLMPSARAIIDSSTLTQGTADVLADHTGNFFHQPSGDVRLVTESGHNYVPEPSAAIALLASLARLAIGRRRRR
jgi:hypothetical protein